MYFQLFNGVQHWILSWEEGPRDETIVTGVPDIMSLQKHSRDNSSIQ